MYILLLCLRYLRTRYIALASIVSVMLGVATMIVVNSVMSGFTAEMQSRLHGILGDISIESISVDGFADVEANMEKVKEVLGEDVEGMTPTVTTAGILAFKFQGRWITQEVIITGIDPETRGAVGAFDEYLHRGKASFELDEAGWDHRRSGYSMVPEESEKSSDDPFGSLDLPEFDPAAEQHAGIILGVGLSKVQSGSEKFNLLETGDDVRLTFATSDQPPVGVTETFTGVDFYESKMSEYDSRFVFVDLKKLQSLRKMSGRVNQIQLKIKSGLKLEEVRDRLREVFDPSEFVVLTWRDQQLSLLQAVEVEISILNVLLFLIIAVSGFGILAIFFMVVKDKTRDIGILKALGASSRGIMGIFLMYGLSLGVVGAGLGLVIGLVLTVNINKVSNILSWMLGHEVFDPSIYYFYKIPYIIDPWTITWIVSGAILIAVMASVIPASKASRLQPVESLRYE